MAATIGAPQKTGGGRTTVKKSRKANAIDFMGKGKTFISSLKTTVVPIFVALIAVAIAVRWGKRDEKTGKPTIAFPFIAAAVAWIVPETVLFRGDRQSFGGALTKASLRMAGAFAFLLALTFDDLIGPVWRNALQGGKETASFVGRTLVWAGDLFNGHGKALQFVTGAKDLPRTQPQPQMQPDPQSYQGDSFAYQPPPQQQAPQQQAPAAGGGGGNDLAGAIFGFLGQAAQAVPGIIGAFNPAAPAGTNPGSQAGLAGGGNPYRALAYARAA